MITAYFRREFSNYWPLRLERARWDPPWSLRVQLLLYQILRIWYSLGFLESYGYIDSMESAFFEILRLGPVNIAGKSYPLISFEFLNFLRKFVYLEPRTACPNTTYTPKVQPALILQEWSKSKVNDNIIFAIEFL